MSELETVKIKQRIIGALVLISMGVVLIPMLLNGGTEVAGKLSGDNIPIMPESLKRELPVVPEPMMMPERKIITAYPQRSHSVKPVVAIKAQAEVKITTEKKSAANKFEKLTQPKTKAVNQAYTLQIASFRKKSNADALQMKLRKKKYKAYIETVQTAKGRVYRLRVGPYLKFAQIAAIKKTIETQFKLKGTVIVKY